MILLAPRRRPSSKGREQFDQMVELIRQASHDGQRIDTVERDLMRQLLGLGHTLLSLFVSQQVVGGDLGPTATD